MESINRQMDLILSLSKLWIGSVLGRWTDDVNAGKVPPIYVSLIYFLLAIPSPIIRGLVFVAFDE